MQKTYDVRETVIESGYTAKHVRDLLNAQRIEGARKVGGKWMIPQAAVKQLKARKQAQ